MNLVSPRNDGIAHTAVPHADFMLLEGITKTFDTASGDTVQALRRVDLAIGDGQFASVIGSSGCGKTTLMRIIAGLELDYGGRVTIGGRAHSGPSRDIGIVFQDANLLPWRTILDNVMLPAEVLKLDRQASLDRAKWLISLVGLGGFEARYPSELSGGMRQRAAIARALVHDPSVLLMDEPFGALDALTRETMNLELLKIWSAAKKTVFMITHSITEAVFMSDRVIVMTPRPGRVVDDVTIDLPRPRTLDLMSEPQFGDYTRKLRRRLNEA
ncbi:ABC transporter ATP-binding protein [Bosea sp. BK604]|uniref:ABC transporter ATP-binding protein n=1 Tax=Bosea sp. BK604 TaxID=2512180 RepID=UPI00104AB5F5|nr:ABC transporter ATP-binding protein [Bosea sp. BK604]TCR60799.1 NitT/TauT family transport system ATP-binding protein [Bosea sp. BK604]